MERSHAAALLTGAALGAGAALVLARAAAQRSQNTAADAASSAAQQRAAADGVQAAGAANGSATCSSVLANFDQDEILEEQLTRNLQFFGLDAQRRIGGAFVVVVGLGGVGSHAAHLLLRSGVGRLRLIDFDQVTLSSLNRHCLATRADVGTPKATCLAKHFRDIVPEADVEAVVEMYTAERENALLAGNPDFVFDAIDNIDTKVELLAACQKRGLAVLSSAGAGAKADPTRLRIVDVGEASADPLARAVRHRLRRDCGISAGVPILLSTEKPRCGLLYHGDSAVNPLDYQVVPNFRVGTIPVLGTTPSIFGLAAASWILCQLAGQPYSPEPHFRIQPKQFAGIFEALYEREELRFGSPEGVGVDAEEVEVLVKELWHGYSARAPHPPQHDKGITRSVGHLTLTRWDPQRPATIDNLVLLTHAEADVHDELQTLNALWQQEPELCERVEAVLARARREFLWRCLSVDDGLVDSALNAAYEDTVVASGMVNPNGCRPPVTWFTDGRSDCSAVQEAYTAGHEIATHTRTHPKNGADLSYDEWVEEVGAQKDWLVDECGVPAEAVQGFRAPYFTTNGALGDALQDLGFVWDSSLSGREVAPAAPMTDAFPFTCLKDGECDGWNQLCLWEVPAYLLEGSGKRADPEPLSGKSVLERLQADFERKRGTRVPVSIMTHEDYLADSSKRADIVSFLAWAASQGDTWVLTYGQYVAWLQAGQPAISDVLSNHSCNGADR